jgi:hypothetical protein
MESAAKLPRPAFGFRQPNARIALLNVGCRACVGSGEGTGGWGVLRGAGPALRADAAGAHSSIESNIETLVISFVQWDGDLAV